MHCENTELGPPSGTGSTSHQPVNPFLLIRLQQPLSVITSFSLSFFQDFGIVPSIITAQVFSVYCTTNTSQFTCFSRLATPLPSITKGWIIQYSWWISAIRNLLPKQQHAQKEDKWNYTKFMHDIIVTSYSEAKNPNTSKRITVKITLLYVCWNRLFSLNYFFTECQFSLTWEKNVAINMALFSASLYLEMNNALTLSTNSNKTISSTFRPDKNTDLGDRTSSSQVLCTGLGHICSFCCPANCSPEQHTKPWQWPGQCVGIKMSRQSRNPPQHREFKHFNVTVYSWHEHGLFFIYFTLLEIRECYFYARSRYVILSTAITHTKRSHLAG